MEKELEHYFATNETEEISGSTLWEAHKAYIRGILIDVGARNKRERTGKIKNLIEEIFKAEQEHKKQKGLHSATYQKLVIKRDKLKDLMEQETKKKHSTE